MEKTKKGYLTRQDEKAITKHNKEQITRLEKAKRARRQESDYLTQMRDSRNIVEFDDLHTYFFSDRGVVKAVGGVSFDIPKNKTVGIVGESGCGKSVSAMSLMRLITGPQGQIVSGSIRFEAKDGKVFDIAKMPMNEMHKLRGKEMSMIFQEPMTSLNPVFKIGMQLDEVSIAHLGYNKKQAKEWSISLLAKVGIPDAPSVYDKYPHQLSGGMRQRVMISMALACNPRLIIADEPTTALDVTIQAQILDLLRSIKNDIDSSIMLITHDLGVIAEMADFVIVMYAGRVVEAGTVDEIFYNPAHPYTRGLQDSKPILGSKIEKLHSIPGNVPNPINMPTHCYFLDRCSYACQACKGPYPPKQQISDTHYAVCHRVDEILKISRNNLAHNNIVPNNTKDNAQNENLINQKQDIIPQETIQSNTQLIELDNNTPILSTKSDSIIEDNTSILTSQHYADIPHNNLAQIEQASAVDASNETSQVSTTISTKITTKPAITTKPSKTAQKTNATKEKTSIMMAKLKEISQRTTTAESLAQKSNGSATKSNAASTIRASASTKSKGGAK